MDALELGTFTEYSLNLSGLFGLQTTGDYYVLTLGIPIAVCAVIALAYTLFEAKGEKQDSYVRCLFVLGAFLTFMMMSLFSGWKMMTIPVLDLILKKIQFFNIFDNFCSNCQMPFSYRSHLPLSVFAQRKTPVDAGAFQT